jgi:proteasome accessory factor C
VKLRVEGYANMGDEAFARRFYADRSELQGLGVPIASVRDEFTSEELYSLREEQYFLPPVELTDSELAALQTSFYLLEGQFAYAEPLRLALQNLALGRAWPIADPGPKTATVELLGPSYTSEVAQRLAKLEQAISRQRTVKFRYWTISSDSEAERTVNPYGLFELNGVWYVVGDDLDREEGSDRRRTFRVSRIRGEIKFATRRERDFRMPADFNVTAYRDRAPWRLVAEDSGTAVLNVAPDASWLVERRFGAYGEFEEQADGSGRFTTPYSDIEPLAAWILSLGGRAVPVEPAELVDSVAADLRTVAEAHSAPARTLPGAAKPSRAPEPSLQARGPSAVAPERFALLQALLAFLLARCGEGSSARVEAAEVEERFQLDPQELKESLELLNLVNFGGGCYAVYAELDGDTVRVDKELFGDTFRAPPRLTPLEARAIRLALEFVGPMIAADAGSALDRVRAKLEETFGEFELAQTPEPHVQRAEEDLVGTLSHGLRERRLVEIDYLKEGEEEVSTHLVEPYSLERRLPYWYVHTWDRTRDGERSFRLDRMRSARIQRGHFEPREGFDPHEFRDARPARIWYSPEIARWELEKGARRLADGSAVAERPVGSPEWLVGEILSYRGEAVVLEPPELRREIVARAKAVQRELGLSRVRVG